MLDPGKSVLMTINSTSRRRFPEQINMGMLPVDKPTLVISYTFITNNHNKIDLQADFYIAADLQINFIGCCLNLIVLAHHK